MNGAPHATEEQRLTVLVRGESLNRSWITSEQVRSAAFSRGFLIYGGFVHYAQSSQA